MKYTIGAVARQSGFPASTLRYYESLGLLAPSARSDAGYRLYDDRVLDRLAFVARAKQLGCSLDEIGDLVELWEREECAPVQRRLHALVTRRIASAEQQIAGLRTFTGQLRDAARKLAGPPTDGACDAGCACSTAHDDPTVETPAPVTVEPDGIACTLEADAMTDRVHEWRALLAHARERTPLAAGPARIELGRDTPLGDLVRLIEAEQRCCSFLSFAIFVHAAGVTVEITAPADAAPMLDALFAG